LNEYIEIHGQQNIKFSDKDVGIICINARSL